MQRAKRTAVRPDPNPRIPPEETEAAAMYGVETAEDVIHGRDQADSLFSDPMILDENEGAPAEKR
ncbi:MAG: hypothetical protein HYV26_15210 [Candidatus Hydrogenedentes bacterium]|nr:hypothetical protein [Candidatus Hydrogenedentota bacterium]